jgi:DNA-binding response OmpR family regulator
VILLLSANWPQRALLRAQLRADTGRDVVAVDTPEDALHWLDDSDFDLLVLDTQGLQPDEDLLSTVRARRLPVVLVTGAFDEPSWGSHCSALDVRARLVRPVFIGEVSRAAREGIT